MPTSYGPVLIGSYQKLDPPFTLTTSGSYNSFISMRDRTATVRRVKPVDLFLNGTAWIANSDVTVTGESRWISNGYSFIAPTQIICGYPAAPEPPDPTELAGKLRLKIKSQNVNLAQSLAEYRQTSSMFVDLAQDVIKTFRSLRSGRALGDFVRILKTPRSRAELNISNRWLQYQYGVRPLMADIYGSVEALATKIRTGMYLYVRVSKQTMAFGSSYKSRNTYGPDTNVIGLMSSYTQTRNKYVARYKIQDAALKQLTQIGITNPLLLAWEIVPYSFVFDWIIPVGDFLSSLDALNGTSDLRIIKSRKFTQVSKGEVYGATTVRTFTRTERWAPTDVLPMPGLVYRPSQSLKAVVNGLALLKQLRPR